METNKNFFEAKIKPILTYIGTIGAALMSVAYVILVCIMIFGFSAHNAVQTIVFAVINGIVGLMIMQMLKVQGQDFAKQLPENVPILEEYYNTKTKDKKFHSMKYFWIKTVITDTLSKGISIVISTAGIIYIVIAGSDDYVLLLLAAVNLIMFACFGLLSLSKAYDFFNNQHMVYVKEQLRLYKEEQERVCKLSEQVSEESKTEETKEESKAETNELLEMVKEVVFK